MDPAALGAVLRSSLEGRPAAVVPVHLYGEPAALPAILDLARTHGLRVIEDCAQSHGAALAEGTTGGRVTGGWGDIACFSFYPTKNLGALGDGGIVVTGDAGLATAAREIREYGWRDRYISARTGINTRLDPIQAAILGVKLPGLAADNGRRRAIAARYDAGLAGLDLRLPPCRAGATHVYHQYVIRLAARDRLRDHLRAEGIGTGIHYPAPVHQQPGYKDRLAGRLAESERAAPEILSLPMYPQLSDAAVERVVKAIREFL
jgi:dTDP-4-amino-4,6-dideoxygalactose transaminase